MKKVFVLFLGMFIFSGCDVVYEVDLRGSTIAEGMSISSSDNAEADILKKYSMNDAAYYNQQISSETNVVDESVDYYKRVFANNKLSFSYDFPRSEYYRSNIVNTCYEFFNYSDERNVYVLSTSKKFLCFDTYPNLDSVLVKVIVDFDVKEHNADSVSGSVYTWNLQRSSDDNSIFMRGAKQAGTEGPIVRPDEPTSEGPGSVADDEDERNALVIVLMGLGGFVLVLFILTKIKVRNN